MPDTNRETSSLAIESRRRLPDRRQDRLSESEYERFQTLNQAYKDKFGFPFIVAVKYHTKESILESFETRLKNSLAAEKQQALSEICKIARLRLESLIMG